MSSELIDRPSLAPLPARTAPLRAIATLPDTRVVRGGSALLTAMRPHQWAKQVFVGAAPLLAGMLLVPSSWLQIILAVIAFSLAASAGYLHNDIGDVAEDRKHPRKRFRPIASGALPIPIARAASFLLFFVAVAVAGVSSMQLAVVVALYSALTVTYTTYLKHIPTVDVVSVAACFTLRALGGAVAVHARVTVWFFVVATAAALFLALGKREAELLSLLEAGEDAPLSRRALKGYTLPYVRAFRVTVLATLVASYIGWALARSHGLTGHVPFFALSILPFLVVIGRYSRSLAQGDGEDPQEVIRSDRALLIAGAATAVLVLLGAYVG